MARLSDLYRLAIVGHAADKFTPLTESVARILIRELVSSDTQVVSGGCHLGGIDQWAEEIGREHGVEPLIHHPTKRNWSEGYSQRNLRIARDCDEAYCIVVSEYPPDFTGERYGKGKCYHCLDKRPQHVKSGGCWTLKAAARLDKSCLWYIIHPDGSVTHAH